MGDVGDMGDMGDMGGMGDMGDMDERSPGNERVVREQGVFQTHKRRRVFLVELQGEGVGVPGCEGPATYTTHFQAGQHAP